MPLYKLRYKVVNGVTLQQTDARAHLYPDKEQSETGLNFDSARGYIEALRSEGKLYTSQHNDDPRIDIDGRFALSVYGTAVPDLLREMALSNPSAKPLDNNAVSTIVANLAGLCRRSGVTVPVFMRCGVDEIKRRHFIELGDSIIELSADGHRVVKDPSTLPVRIIQGANAAPMPTPSIVDPVDLPSRVEAVWETLNIDEPYRLVLLACMVNSLLCRKQNPIMLFVGPPNSGKSVALQQVRDLIDPQNLELGSKPSDQNDFVSRLSSNYMTAFDNMKGVTGTVEDILCNAADGGVYTKRRLRTTNDNASIDVSGPMGFTSVQSRIFKQEDLQSRAVTIRVSPSKNRKDRQEIETAYQEAKGEIFSTFVALAVEVLKVQPEITDSSGHRYDQFVKTGNAILQVLGCDETMANLFERERLAALEEEIDSHPSALRALVKLMLIERSWNKACLLYTSPSPRDRTRSRMPCSA